MGSAEVPTGIGRECVAESTAVNAATLPAVQVKKRSPKPGTRRLTVSLTEDEYKALVEVSADQMREPNNMLSFLLKGRIEGMLAEYDTE